MLRLHRRLLSNFRPSFTATTMSTHSTPTALIPIADGSEETEAVTLADVLVRGGVKVTMATVGQKTNNVVAMSRGVKIQGDAAIEDCNDVSYDLIVVPGGKQGAENLSACETLTTLLQKQKEQGKLYGAICAAPGIVLAPHGLLPAEATGYPGFEDRMTSTRLSEDTVVVSGHCVTSRGPGTAMAMAIKLVEILSGKETADSVAKGLLHPFA